MATSVGSVGIVLPGVVGGAEPRRRFFSDDRAGREAVVVPSPRRAPPRSDASLCEPLSSSLAAAASPPRRRRAPSLPKRSVTVGDFSMSSSSGSTSSVERDVDDSSSVEDASPKRLRLTDREAEGLFSPAAGEDSSLSWSSSSSVSSSSPLRAPAALSPGHINLTPPTSRVLSALAMSSADRSSFPVPARRDDSIRTIPRTSETNRRTNRIASCFLFVFFSSMQPSSSSSS
mmetsp:Transcript_3872/g.10617  ORF Transcript_3872/g.10617 Transcript_3872/m.10617 type:complete len:231 (-) Transcript_3872:452-1144(-)